MYCGNCGNNVDSSSAFCPNCGMPVNVEKQEVANQPQSEQQRQGEQQPQGYQPNSWQNSVPADYNPQDYYGQPAPAKSETNGMAIAGFVLSFFFSLLGLIFSGIGLSKANKTPGQPGRGLAIAGLVLSIVFIVMYIIVVSCIGSLVGFSSYYYY